jgi:hypothetical protein
VNPVLGGAYWIHVLAWRVNSITNTGSAVHCNKESSIMGKSSILSTVKNELRGHSGHIYMAYK